MKKKPKKLQPHGLNRCVVVPTDRWGALINSKLFTGGKCDDAIVSPQRCQRRSPGALSYTERSSTPLALKPNIEGREGERGGWCRSGSFPTDNAIISAPLVRNARFHRPLPSSERRSQHLQRVCCLRPFPPSRRPSTLSAPAWPPIPVGHRACLPFLRIQLPPSTKFQ